MTVTSKVLKEYMVRAKETDEWWIENAKIEFAIELDKAFYESKMTKQELAKKLGTNVQYVNKVLRGDANITITTMVRFIIAIKKSRLTFKIVKEN